MKSEHHSLSFDVNIDGVRGGGRGRVGIIVMVMDENEEKS